MSTARRIQPTQPPPASDLDPMLIAFARKLADLVLADVERYPDLPPPDTTKEARRP